jgi:hypothetical protein
MASTCQSFVGAFNDREDYTLKADAAQEARDRTSGPLGSRLIAGCFILTDAWNQDGLKNLDHPSVEKVTTYRQTD